MGEDIKKAKWHADQMNEANDIVQDLLEEDNFDEAGFYLDDLKEHAIKLSECIEKLI